MNRGLLSRLPEELRRPERVVQLMVAVNGVGESLKNEVLYNQYETGAMTT